ncbi:hypothetical protein IWZ03DRAFT_442336 [Phyllosticta citriasiana]|uniref:Uncharacterized protein n=1 Tax=Phyllosticta citriasiana TaxID=595635 RepID=A0ABR1KIQ5_9PEZI
MSTTQSQQNGAALAKDMHHLCLSRDVKHKTPTTKPPTTNSTTPRFYRLDLSQFTFDRVSVWRVCFYKPLPPGAAAGTERCRLQSKWRQRQLMPLVFDTFGIEPDRHWTNGCDRIFSVPEWSLDKVDAASADRTDFELHAPRGAGGRFGVVVELIERDMKVPRALPVGSSAASLTADQFRFLECAMHAFARAQVWKAKRDGIDGLILVGKNRYFDATPEHVLNYKSFQVRRGVAISLMRDSCLLKLTPLSHTFLVKGSLSKFVESLVSPGGVSTIPNDALEHIKDSCSHIKVRYNYLATGQQKEKVGSCQSKRLEESDIQMEGKLRRICAFGNNAEKTKFLHTPKTAGGCSELLSVREHFENRVFPGAKLRYPKWPVANTGTIENPTWIPLELLWIETDQPIDELPPQVPVAVGRLFSEKHAENIGGFDDVIFGDLLKLDEVNDRLGIKFEEVQREQTVVEDPPKALPNGTQQLSASQDLLVLHVDGARSAKDYHWDCGATFAKLLSGLQKYGALKLDGSPSCDHIMLSRLNQRTLSERFTLTKKQGDNKMLLIACLSGEKQERDRAYREIKEWGEAENVSTVALQAQKFRENVELWATDLSEPLDKKNWAAVGYVKSVSRKVLARCGPRFGNDAVATPKKPRVSVNGEISCNGKA